MTEKAFDLTNLEVDAQGRHMCPGQIPTFASAGDIHSRQVPEEHANGDYRPGGIPPEMPPTLVGSRKSRQERARDFAARAQAVAQKTRNLIVLEAESSYYRLLEAQNKSAGLRDAGKAGTRLIEETPKDFAGLQKVKVEDVLTNLVLGAQARSQYNEALWQYLLAAAALERVTGGGFCPDLASTLAKGK
jgi:hypothetical protein